MSIPSRLLTVDEAVALILDRARPLAPERLPLWRLPGLILAEPILADIDLPPFPKATMDGYAVRSADLAAPGEHWLRLVGAVLAGQTSDRPSGPGEATQIMTGAPLPPGADAVVNVERTRVEPGQPDRVALNLAAAVPPGQFILPQGREMWAGDRLLYPGTAITPTMIGLLAAVGRTEVAAIPWPTGVVRPTGDELVAPDAIPGPGQIRNSNGPMLAALMHPPGPGGHVTHLPPIPDRAEDLLAELASNLALWDVLVLSGGVSMGTKDLVPAALIELGVEPVFHRVAVKPGKPIWFGVGPPRPGGRPGSLVFGLPGNPASGVVGFLLFVRPALDALAGRGARPAAIVPKRLAADFAHRGDRPTFHPVRLGPAGMEPLRWAGSADLRAVALADGFAAFAAGDRDHRAGDEVGFLALA